jgi:hypothetical protein
MLASRENAVLARQQLRLLARSLPDAVLAQHRDRITDLMTFLAVCEETLSLEASIRANKRRKVRRNRGG